MAHTVSVEDLEIRRRLGLAGEEAELELEWTPNVEHEVQLRVCEDASLVAGYLIADDSGDVLAWDESAQGQIESHRSEGAQREALLEHAASGTPAYVFTVGDRRDFALYLPPDDMCKAFAEDELSIDELDRFVAGVFDEYRKVSEGEVFIAIVETFRHRGGGRFEQVDSDMLCGLIGAEWADEVLRHEMLGDPRPQEPRERAVVPEAAPSP